MQGTFDPQQELMDAGALVGRIDQATVVRLESGSFTTPAPGKLARTAEALGLPLADAYALAGYSVPSFRLYLRAKYQGLPQKDIERYAARLAKKDGIALSGPAPGADES